MCASFYTWFITARMFLTRNSIWKMLILQFGEVNYFHLPKTFEELQFCREGDSSLHKTRENNVMASPAPAQNYPKPRAGSALWSKYIFIMSLHSFNVSAVLQNYEFMLAIGRKCTPIHFIIEWISHCFFTK